MFRQRTWMLVIVSLVPVTAGAWMYRSGCFAWLGLANAPSRSGAIAGPPEGGARGWTSAVVGAPAEARHVQPRRFDPSNRIASQQWLAGLVLRLRESKTQAKPEAFTDELRRVEQEVNAVKQVRVRWECPCYLETDQNEAVVVANDWSCSLNRQGFEAAPSHFDVASGGVLVDYRVWSAASKELPRPAVARRGIEIAAEKFQRLRDGDTVLLEGDVSIVFPAEVIERGEGRITVFIEKAKIVGK